MDGEESNVIEKMGGVALLVDFENLVLGIGGEDVIDCSAILRFAGEFGRPLVCRAYADWRYHNVNQYQEDLYSSGIELVHVLGRRKNNAFKNSVDIRMAVDAVALVYENPRIETFVIVSGDRDFVHVVQSLRQRNKLVIGVSPAKSSSEDLAGLCDRFVTFEAIDLPPASISPTASSNLAQVEEVRDVLRNLLATTPNGVKGAALKSLLRQGISSTFDERNYGHSRFLDFLRSMPDIVRVETPNGPGDIIVFPASPVTSDVKATPAQEQVRLTVAGLHKYRFEPNPEKRRQVLAILYEIISSQERFRWADSQDTAVAAFEKAGLNLSAATVGKYGSILYQNRVFVFDEADMAPFAERSACLRDDIVNLQDFVEAYESAIVYKLRCASVERPLDATEISEVLGYSRSDSNDAYVAHLLAKQRASG